MDSDPYSEEKDEECGVIAIYSKKGQDVAPLLYRSLVALQHRGQDAAGFAIYHDGKIDLHRGVGLVNEIFNEKDMQAKGNFGIGHTRYPTIGKCRVCDVQPTITGEIAVAHNGHIANYNDIKKEAHENGIDFESTVDSEPMGYLLHGHNEDVEKGVRTVMEKLEGAFSDVSIHNGRLVVFRDRFALRPLVWGENDDLICFASESVALDINNVPYKGEVKGGEMIIIENNKLYRKQLIEERRRYCMFEYVYFSRPDSIINGKGVFEVRKRLGETLAKEAPVKADVVVPVPDTSRTAALAYATALGIEYEEGLIKNRYIGRTFIMPDQKAREFAVKQKLNPVRQVISGKRIVLFDDSIVRGTTLKGIVSMVRTAGAKEIHLRITCPPVISPCYYGVDMPTYKEFIANKKTIDEIREHLGADSLSYISLQGLKEAIGLPVCTGCLTEEYHTDYIRKLAEDEKTR